MPGRFGVMHFDLPQCTAIRDNMDPGGVLDGWLHRVTKPDGPGGCTPGPFCWRVAGRSKHWIKVKNRNHPAMDRVMDSTLAQQQLTLVSERSGEPLQPNLLNVNRGGSPGKSARKRRT
jgi:hypothetical protein